MTVIYLSASNAPRTLAIPHHSPPLQFHRPSLCSRSTWTWHLPPKLSASQPLALDLKLSVPSLALSHGHESVDRNDAASTGPLISPHPGLAAEEAVKAQLDALLRNDEPRKDHGLEVMYHFANAEGTLDGGNLSCYFGFPADLYHFGHFCMKFKSRSCYPLKNFVSMVRLLSSILLLPEYVCSSLELMAVHQCGLSYYQRFKEEHKVSVG